MNVNERITILCAVRYAIGRASYAPGAIIDYIKERVDYIDKKQLPKFINNIEKDLNEYIETHPYMGNFEYKQDWLDLIEYLKTKK